jgi:hypothetical protein
MKALLVLEYSPQPLEACDAANYQFLVAQYTQQSTVEPDCSQNVIRCGKHETNE